MQKHVLIPLGMSGLKLCGSLTLRSTQSSHPAWDEWIEISMVNSRQPAVRFSSRLGWVDWNCPGCSGSISRSVLIPLGMSGLKFFSERENQKELVLIPLGMSGLKSYFEVKWTPDGLSHPAWDEWIEIKKELEDILHPVSHPAWDEWIEIGSYHESLDYQPKFSSRLGWVDWNKVKGLVDLSNAFSSRLGWVDWNSMDEGETTSDVVLIPLGMSGLK